MSRYRAVLLGILVLVIWGAFPTPPALGTTRVEPGVPVESTLAAGGSDRYESPLRAGQFLHLTIEQNHLDASAKILSEGGAELGEADNAADEDDPITLSIVAARDETHGIEIRLRSGKSGRGKYRLSVDPPRDATAQDAKRIEAERIRSQGDALLARSTADTSRKAIELYEKAVLVWREIGDRREEAATLDRITDTLGWLGDLRPALERAQQSLALWRELGDRRGEASALDELGLAHARVGEQGQGIEFFEQALALRRADHNLRGLAETLNNMATARSAMGEYPEAVARYTEAIENASAFGDPAIEATMRKNRAVNYAILGDLDRSFEDLQRALSQFRRLEDHHQEGVALYSLGNVYLDRGEIAEALRHYRMALPLLQKAGDRVAEAATVNHIGMAELASRRPEAALDEFQRARELLQASGDRRREAAVMANIARAHLEMGDAAGARERFLEALPRIQASGDRGNEATDLVHLARAERALGHLEEAHARIEEALRFTESLRGSIPALGERAMFMAKTRDRYDLLVDILMDLNARHPDQGWDAEAMHASERAKARSLVDLLAEARVDLRQGIDPELLARERTLESQIETRRRDAERKAAEPSAPPSAAEGRSLDALLAEYEDVEGTLRTANPRFAALARPQPLTVKEIQQQVLDSDTVLLEYDLGDERGFVWAVTAHGMTSHALPRRAVIESAARRVYEAWSGGAVVPEQEAGRRATALSRLLLGPVARELGRKRIAVVAEEALLYVPFAALPSPEKGFASPLIAGHEVVSLPSATTLAVLRREAPRRRTPDRGVAVLADPVFDREDRRVLASARVAAPRPQEPESENLSRSIRDAGLLRLDRLNGSRREAEGIAALAGKEDTLMALDFQASRPTAMGAEVSRSRIVHFATHAILDGKHPEFSGIVLSLVDEDGRPADGFLQTRDVYKLNLSADLVVLSACQTALGKEVRGEGLLGFSRAFMYAGAPRIVASLWRVPDRATAELMNRFYRGILAEGLRPAAALREAQTALRREKRWSSPYYWAAFTLQGDWN
jgi:CHAT domain-containing protein/tetratricopeptide (TPR) repeat protein